MLELCFRVLSMTFSSSWELGYVVKGRVRHLSTSVSKSLTLQLTTATEAKLVAQNTRLVTSRVAKCYLPLSDRIFKTFLPGKICQHASN